MQLLRTYYCNWCQLRVFITDNLYINCIFTRESVSAVFMKKTLANTFLSLYRSYYSALVTLLLRKGMKKPSLFSYLYLQKINYPTINLYSKICVTFDHTLTNKTKPRE